MMAPSYSALLQEGKLIEEINMQLSRPRRSDKSLLLQSKLRPTQEFTVPVQ